MAILQSALHSCQVYEYAFVPAFYSIHKLLDRIILCNGKFFCDDHLFRFIMLDTYMSPEAENFLADGMLESVCKSKGNDHCRYTDSGGGNRKPDDKSGKGFLRVKGHPAGNVSGDVQSL